VTKSLCRKKGLGMAGSKFLELSSKVSKGNPAAGTVGGQASQEKWKVQM
jgi:hypothetical protein